MSLTSYRAAPPRDKPLPKPFVGKRGARAGHATAAPISPLSFLRRLPCRALPEGCAGYVSMRNWFGKGFDRSFFDFMTGQMSQNGAKMPALARSFAKDEALETNFAV
jgi:hypothetical protein